MSRVLIETNSGKVFGTRKQVQERRIRTQEEIEESRKHHMDFRLNFTEPAFFTMKGSITLQVFSVLMLKLHHLQGLQQQYHLKKSLTASKQSVRKSWKSSRQ